jgi:hypothetical protein
MAIVMLVTTIQQSAVSMEAIVKNSISIPTAMRNLHGGLEMAIAIIMVTTIQPRVASMEAIVTAISHIHI